MRQTPDKKTVSLFSSSDFNYYLEIAKKHFPDFFDSNDQYDLLKPFVENQLLNYAVLCQLLPNNIENIKSLISSLLQLFDQAYRTDPRTAIKVFALAATDFDGSAIKNAHLSSEYKSVVDNSSAMLPRDEAFKLLNNIEGLIEGVFKKRVWVLLACQDIIKKNSRSPERWRDENLGNIVKAIKAMPKPAGEILGGDPIAGITLNQLRNIDAHKDFEIKDGKVLLRTRKIHKTETINTLYSAVDDLRERVRIVVIVLRIAFTKYLNELIDAGYKPGAYLPENSTTTLSSQLIDRGIILHSVDYEDGIITVKCSIQDSKINPIDALNICFNRILMIQNVYWGTFLEKPEDIFTIVISYKKRMEAKLTTSRKDWHNLLQEKPEQSTLIEYSLDHEKILYRYDPESKKWKTKLGAVWWKFLLFRLFGFKPKILNYWISARENLELFDEEDA